MISVNCASKMKIFSYLPYNFAKIRIIPSIMKTKHFSTSCYAQKNMQYFLPHHAKQKPERVILLTKSFKVAASMLVTSSRHQHNGLSKTAFCKDIQNIPETVATTDNTVFFSEIEGTDTATSLPNNTVQTESFADYGLGGWDMPHHWIQTLMEYLHNSWDIGWIPTIAILTVAVRFSVIPAYIKMRQFTARSHNHMPEQLRMQMNINDPNPIEHKRKAMEYMQFLNKNQINPLKPLLYNLPTGLIFISFFAALRGMAKAKLPSLASGGALWFTDLTISDPYFLLPVLTCTSLHLLIRYGGASTEVGPMEHVPFLKKVLLWVPFAFIPFLMFQPACMFIFWMTSNVFSFFLMLLFLQPSVQKACGIPKMVTHPPSLKDEMSNFMSMRSIRARHQQLRQQALQRVEGHMNQIEKMNKDKKRSKKFSGK